MLVVQLGSTTTLDLPYYKLPSLKLVSFGLGVFWNKPWKDIVFDSEVTPAGCSWGFLVKNFVQVCAALGSVHWFCTGSIFLLYCRPAVPQEEILLLFAGFQFWELSVLFLWQDMQNPCMAEHTFFKSADSCSFPADAHLQLPLSTRSWTRPLETNKESYTGPVTDTKLD